MPEIGATLREARMRARIDISEIEAETKIRAKYLRALENEEWDLLPGPTFVKSFLRTYAEALDLDAKLLLEEFKLRHERPTEHDLQPIITRRTTTAGRRRQPERRGLPRGYVIWGLTLALLAVLLLLTRGGDEEPDVAETPVTVPTGPVGGTTTTEERQTAEERRAAERRRAARRRAARLVSLQVQPTGAVFVCLEARGQGRLLNGVELQPGTARRTYRSSRFDITLGNGNAVLVVDGRRFRVPDVADGVGYRFTKADGEVRRTRLTPQQRPACLG
jgi:cytoskeleton protein RodZ